MNPLVTGPSRLVVGVPATPCEAVIRVEGS